jgi:DNA-binding winged helix-turn-helix (wHTH) protein
MEQPQTYIYEFDDFRVDPGRRLLLGGDGRPLPLTPKAFDTLVYLVQHTDVVLGKNPIPGSSSWITTQSMAMK